MVVSTQHAAERAPEPDAATFRASPIPPGVALQAGGPRFEPGTAHSPTPRHEREERTRSGRPAHRASRAMEAIWKRTAPVTPHTLGQGANRAGRAVTRLTCSRGQAPPSNDV